MRASDTALIFFDDVRVPQRYRDRPGRHGLHLSDDAVPGGAAVGRGRRSASSMERMIDRTRSTTRASAGLRPEHPRQPGRALPAGRAADRRSNAARARSTAPCEEYSPAGRHQAGLDGEAQGRSPAARGRRQLPAILGRHGFHERDRRSPASSATAAWPRSAAAPTRSCWPSSASPWAPSPARSARARTNDGSYGSGPGLSASPLPP